MKRNLLIAFAMALFCFLTPNNLKACTFTNHFSQYNADPTTSVISQSGASINLMVYYYTQTSGYSSITPDCTMPYPYVYHRAWARITTPPGSSGRQEGPASCATCQLSKSASYSSSLSSNDVPILTHEDGGADCSMAGDFFSYLPTLQIEVAYTRAKGVGTYSGCTGVASVVCDYDTFSDCTPSTSPPDMQIGKVRASFPQAPPLIWECFGLGFRWYPYQGNWTFTNVTTYAYKSGIDLPANCTHNP